MVFSIRMRAAQGGAHEKGGRHISGAERLVGEDALSRTAGEMVERALHHSKGRADFIRITMEEVDPASTKEIEPPAIREYEGKTMEETREKGLAVLAAHGVNRTAAEKALQALLSLDVSMRGAMAVSAETGERMDSLGDRGIRVTRMGFRDKAEAARVLVSHGYEGMHIREALVLAGKVLSCEDVLGELCISDDPEYTTGYVSYRDESGIPVYCRLEPLKPAGCALGGRVFFLKDGADPEKVRAYLEETTVFVRTPALSQTAEITDRTKERKSDLLTGLAAEAESLRHSSVYRKVTDTVQHDAAHARVGGEDCLMLTTNNYLGLAHRKDMEEAAAEAVRQYGTGSGGSRLLSGSFPLFTELEKALAALKETESALVFNTGYMTNLGTVSALIGPKDHVFSDSLNHASIIDGCRLSRGHIHVYPHNDLTALSEMLEDLPDEGRRLIITDGVFSMDGDIADLPGLLRLAEKYDCLLAVDDAHATGIIGNGRGTAHYFGVSSPRLLQIGTLSKAVGSEGGFVCASETIITLLRNRARSFIFSTALTPPDIGAALAGVRLIASGKAPVRKLQDNISFLAGKLAEAGIDVPGKTKDGKVIEDFLPTPIFPIVLGSDERTLAAAEQLRERQILLSAIRPPTVPKGESRLRLTVTADHSFGELAYLADTLKEVIGNLS